MAAKTGRPKGLPKTGGRTKGTPNKRTQYGEENLARLVGVLEDPERVAAEISELHGKDYFKVYFDALQYLRPKYSSVEFHGEMNVENEVAERLRESMDKK